MPPGAKNSCKVGKLRIGLSLEAIGRSLHHSDAGGWVKTWTVNRHLSGEASLRYVHAGLGVIGARLMIQAITGAF